MKLQSPVCAATSMLMSALLVVVAVEPLPRVHQQLRASVHHAQANADRAGQLRLASASGQLLPENGQSLTARVMASVLP